VFLFQFCDVAQVMIIQKKYLAKYGNIQNMGKKKEKEKRI
jgi:hypothetical protein